MTTNTQGEPKIAAAESCERSALTDLQIGSISALTSLVSAGLAALEIYPNATVPAAITAGGVSVLFIVNGFGNNRLARKHRAGISVPG